MSSIHEYDFEPQRGLPGLLPSGERQLWQGSPQWKSVLVHVLHVRWVLAYFGILTVWRFYSALDAGISPVAAVTSALWLMPLWLAVLAAMAGYAWAIGRTTIYTITSKRLVIRYGVALQMCVNVPFTKVVGANVRMFSDGTGQLPLELDGDVRLAYLVIWPHARPGQYLNPQPMMRSLADPQSVAKVLASVLSEGDVSVAKPSPQAASASAGWGVPARASPSAFASPEPAFAHSAAE